MVLDDLHADRHLRPQGLAVRIHRLHHQGPGLVRHDGRRAIADPQPHRPVPLVARRKTEGQPLCGQTLVASAQVDLQGRAGARESAAELQIELPPGLDETEVERRLRLRAPGQAPEVQFARRPKGETPLHRHPPLSTGRLAAPLRAILDHLSADPLRCPIPTIDTISSRAITVAAIVTEQQGPPIGKQGAHPLRRPGYTNEAPGPGSDRDLDGIADDGLGGGQHLQPPGGGLDLDPALLLCLDIPTRQQGTQGGWASLHEAYPGGHQAILSGLVTGLASVAEHDLLALDLGLQGEPRDLPGSLDALAGPVIDQLRRHQGLLALDRTGGQADPQADREILDQIPAGLTRQSGHGKAPGTGRGSAQPQDAVATGHPVEPAGLARPPVWLDGIRGRVPRLGQEPVHRPLGRDQQQHLLDKGGDLGLDPRGAR